MKISNNRKAENIRNKCRQVSYEKYIKYVKLVD